MRLRRWGVGLGALALGCSPEPLPTTPAAPVAVTLPDSPASPTHGLPIVAWRAPWSPPRHVAGDLQSLAEALRGAGTIQATVATRLTAPDRVEPVRVALTQLEPAARWSVAAGAWAERVAGGALPLSRVQGEGAPRYDGASVRPRTPVSTTTLVLDDADVDVQRWRAMPAGAAGSCDALVDTLAVSQEQSLAYLETFLDHVDTVLARRYRAGLLAELDGLQQVLAPYAEPKPPADASPARIRAHACGHAQYERLNAAATCTADACLVGPRIVLQAGARIGMPAPAWAPDDCDAASREVADVLESIAVEAVAQTLPELDPRWVTLADRLGALTEVYDAIEDVCTPRRRRFAPADLDDAAERLARIGRALGSDVLDEAGRWEVRPTTGFVPGMGAVTELAAFSAAEGAAARTARSEARGLRRFMLSRSLCRSGFGDRPLAVVVFTPGAESASFFGYLYEEELFCAGLPLEVASSAATSVSTGPAPAAPASAPPPMPAPPPPRAR